MSVGGTALARILLDGRATAGNVAVPDQGREIMRLTTRIIGTTLAATLVSSFAFAAPSDPWITTKAKMSLLTTDGVSANDVNVDTVNGRVTLHGTVGSAAEKAKAESVVKGIDGVTGVRNLVQVVNPKRQDTAAANDADLKTRVTAALGADQDLAKVDASR